MSAVDRFDPEILALFTAAADATTENPEFTMPERGDALGLRSVIDAGLAVIPRPDVAGVSTDSYWVERRDGAGMEVRWYSRDDDDREDRSAIVYFHGGGRVAGTIDHYDGVIQHYVQETSVPMLLVDYRLAPEFTGTAAQEDGFVGLQWLAGHAKDLRVDPSRIGLMGDSGGGGVAAGTAILARDNGAGVAKQILIYPMLDDRTTVTDPALDGLATWTPDTNWTGWHAVLGDSIGGADVSPIAAPARLDDFSGLPPAYIEVGDLDIFRDESMSYAQRLHHAGIPCELHVNAGVIHGHDLMSFDMQLTRRTIADRCRAISTL